MISGRRSVEEEKVHACTYLLLPHSLASLDQRTQVDQLKLTPSNIDKDAYTHHLNLPQLIPSQPHLPKRPRSQLPLEIDPVVSDLEERRLLLPPEPLLELVPG